jgi:hypothetical protein
MAEMTASEMGRKRWKGVSEAERTELARKAVAARHASLTPEQRSEIARKAAHAKAAKARASKKKAGKK